MIILWSSAPSEDLFRVVNPIINTFDPKPEVYFQPHSPGEAFMPSPGSVLVPMGNTPLKELQKKKHYPANKGIKSLRGSVLQPEGCGWIVPTFDPQMTFTEAPATVDIACDLMTVQRILKTGDHWPDIPLYPEWTSLIELRLWIENRFETYDRKIPVSVDCETMGLDPFNPEKKIVSLHVSVEEGIAGGIYLLDEADWSTGGEEWDDFIENVDWLLNSPMVVTIGANFKYDLLWMWIKWGLRCTNFGWDNLLTGSLDDENRHNGLNVHAKLFTEIGGYDDGFNQAYDKAHMEDIPRSEVMQYGSGDADASLRVSKKLINKLWEDNTTADGTPRKDSLANFYTNILHPVCRAFETIEERGMCVDLEEYNKFGGEVENEAAEKLSFLVDHVPGWIVDKHGPEKVAKLTPAVVTDYLFTDKGCGLTPLMITEKSGKISTAGSHLQQFADTDEAGEWVTAYGAWKGLMKVHSTYYVGFLKHLRHDGRFHPSYMLFKSDDGGAVTGRTSARDPAVQTIPKHTPWAKRLRRVFCAPLPGWILWSADYNQGELRIVADIAEDETMLKVYREGGDLHSVTAAGMVGMVLEEFMKLKTTDPELFDLYRTNGKAGNFGLIYGMSPGGFVTYAWTNYGLKITLEEAEVAVEKFFNTYTNLLPYHQKMTNQVYGQGWVRSPLGRIRHLPLIRSPDNKTRSSARRQAINAPVQSTLSDLCGWSIAEIKKWRPDLWVGGMIHDQIFGYCPEDEADETVKGILEIMGNLPLKKTFGWQPKIDFPGDGTIGYNLADQIALDRWPDG